MSFISNPIIPAKAGLQAEAGGRVTSETSTSAWVPAFAGMIREKGRRS
jgi:hypothetical protein